METQCPLKYTAIDHLAIEFTATNKIEYLQLIEFIKDYLRKHQIRIGSNKPKSLGCYHSGNLLYSALKGINKKISGSLKYLPCKRQIKLELNGSQCALIQLTHKAFEPLYLLAKQFQGIIRRIDIYYDDVTGRYNIRRAQKDIAKGLYKPKTGPSPQVHYLGRPAETMYIGSTKSNKFIRIYCKYLEQKLPKSDPLYGLWYRHEMVLKNQGKTEVSLLALIQSHCLFLGEYPKAHRKFVDGGEAINMQRIVAKHIARDISDRTRYAKRQCGRLLNTLDELVDNSELILAGLKRAGTPQGIEIPAALDKALLTNDVIDLLKNEALRSYEGSKHAK